MDKHIAPPRQLHTGRHMDTDTARALIRLNNDFYAHHAESFSSTRSAPWNGWSKLVEVLADRGRGAQDGLRCPKGLPQGTKGLPQGTQGHSQPHQDLAQRELGQPHGTQNPTQGVQNLPDGAQDSQHKTRERPHIGPSLRGEPAISVLDLACGNLRFERFLLASLPAMFPAMELRFHAVDNCTELARDAGNDSLHCTYYQLDVLDELMAASPWQSNMAPQQSTVLDALPTCELSVCFGFMHHVPGVWLRRQVLDMLLDHTIPGGVIALSFWQFMLDDRLARKVALADDTLRSNPELAKRLGIDASHLEENDHFLGWQSDPSPLRYCHHFDEREIDELVTSVGTRAREVARYSADGSSGTLNRYLVLERNA